MEFKNNETYKVVLVTRGRKTGKKHSVFLCAVMYNDKLYVSRRNSCSNWLKNALASTDVVIEYDGQSFEGSARLVNEKELERKISHLKYHDNRASQDRIVLEISLN